MIHIIGLTEDELIERIANRLLPHIVTNNNQVTPNIPIKGIHELAAFLKVSAPRAQKLKNDGVFPYFQDGRLVLFDPHKVREAMANYNLKKKKQK